MHCFRKTIGVCVCTQAQCVMQHSRAKAGITNSTTDNIDICFYIPVEGCRVRMHIKGIDAQVVGSKVKGLKDLHKENKILYQGAPSYLVQLISKVVWCRQK